MTNTNISQTSEVSPDLQQSWRANAENVLDNANDTFQGAVATAFMGFFGVTLQTPLACAAAAGGTVLTLYLASRTLLSAQKLVPKEPAATAAPALLKNDI